MTTPEYLILDAPDLLSAFAPLWVEALIEDALDGVA